MRDLERELEREEDGLDISDSARGSSHVLGAFILGAAAGAALALLYAPASGVATRTYLGRRARDGQRRANKAYKRGVDAFDTGRSALASAVKEGRTRWDQVREHAEGAIEEGRDAAVKIVEHGRQAAGEVKEGFDRIGAVAAGKRR